VHLKGGLSKRVLRDVDEWIDAHLDDEIRLSDLAALAGLSEFHFHRMFRASSGMTPHHCVTYLRILRAKDLLLQIPMSEVAMSCGFSSQSHFIRRFKEQVGVTPGQYVRKIAHEM
jgi:AraC family transcriptional regulator